MKKKNLGLLVDNFDAELSQLLETPGIIFDVRSPAEHQQGRIPGSFSLPLFSNDERAQVGTTYKQVSREAAIELGISITGPKAGDIVKQIAPIVDGGGGGRPQMAQAGGKNPAKLDEALQNAKELIKEKLS